MLIVCMIDVTLCFPYLVTAVDLQTQPQLQNDQQDSEGGCMC